MRSARRHQSVYDVFIISGGTSDSNFVIGKHRAAWMRCSPRSVQQCSHLLEENLHQVFTPHKSTSRNAAPALTTSDGVLLASFSLVNAEPTIGYSFTWDFQSEVEEPFLGQLPKALSRVLELRIEAQVIRHAPSRIRPKWSEDHQGYLLNAKLRLSSSIRTGLLILLSLTRLWMASRYNLWFTYPLEMSAPYMCSIQLAKFLFLIPFSWRVGEEW